MITIACQCGKKFRTSDANAGKRTKCPGCGQVLTIPRAAAPSAAPSAPAPEDDSLDSLSALAAASGAEVYQPTSVKPPTKSGASARSAAPARGPAVPGVPPVSKSERPQRKGGSLAPSISVSPLLMVLIIAAIVIPLTIYWAEHGPMEANRQWKEISGVAEDNLVGQADRAIQYEYKTVLAESMDGLSFHPKAKSMFFDEPAVMWRLPDSVHFQVSSTEGNFKGDFHPKTWQFEMTGNIGGSLHTLTGSASASDQTLFMDGKKIN